MNSWSVLDRCDPAPGDVEGTRGLGERLLRQASDIEAQTAQLRTLAADQGVLQLAGDYAAPYTETLQALPGDLSKLGLAYHRCGTALTGFAQALSEAKGRAGNALRTGQDADLQLRSALRQLHLLLPAAATSPLGPGTSFNPVTVAAAAAGLDPGTQAQIQVAVRQAQNATHDLDQARALADQAAALREDAEHTCVQQITSALDASGIKNTSWLHQAWNAATKPFTSWSSFISLCGKVALVAGIAAIFLSGPLGWALAAAALLAGGLVFADGVAKYSNGQIGVGELALDGLGLVPAGAGGAAIATIDRLATLVRVGDEASGAITLSGALARRGEALAAASNGAAQSVDQIREWLPDVNPGFAENTPSALNCGECAVAVWRRLKGEDAVADLGSYSTKQMESITGVEQLKMSPTEIANALEAKGAGSSAVVGIDRLGWYGHWFNAYYDGEKVVAIDGQSGVIHDWPPNYSLPQGPVVSWDAGVLP